MGKLNQEAKPTYHPDDFEIFVEASKQLEDNGSSSSDEEDKRDAKSPISRGHKRHEESDDNHGPKRDGLGDNKSHHDKSRHLSN